MTRVLTRGSEHAIVLSAPAVLGEGTDPFLVTRERDLLLYHPHDSFAPAIDLIRRAARDPEVLPIE